MNKRILTTTLLLFFIASCFFRKQDIVETRYIVQNDCIVIKDNFYIESIDSIDIKIDTLLKYNCLNINHNLDIDFIQRFPIKFIDDTKILKAINCQISNDNIQLLSKFQNLNYLDLSQNNISNLDGIMNNKNLKHLFLSNTSINDSALAKILNGFDNLVSVDVSKTQINNISEEICKHQKLEVLLISDNNIKTLPNCMCEMLNLRAIGLMNNQNIKLDTCFYSNLTILSH